MRIPVLVLVLAGLVLSSCGGWRNSGWNPTNWFGDDEEEVLVTAEQTNPLIPDTRQARREAQEEVYTGTPVEQVTQVRVERDAEGAIILVTGVARVQGAHSVKLDPENDGKPVDGIMTYRLLAIHPERPTGVGTPTSREIYVAHDLTDQQLQGIRQIRVVAATNARTVRR